MIAGRTRNILAILFALAATGALALLLVLRFGPQFAILAFFSNFTPLLPLAAAASLAAVLILIRGPMARSALLACTVLLVALSAHMLRSRPALLPEPSPDAPQIKIIEFNSWLGNRAPLAAARWILSERPDVIVLAEGGGRSRFMIGRLRRDYPYQVTCHTGRYCSTMILSRLRPIEMRSFADRDIGGRPSLSAAYMRFAAPQGGFGVVGVHFSWPLPQWRQRHEVKALAARLGSIPRDGLVVAGDFNATRYSTTIRTMHSQLGLQLVGSDAGWPAPPSHLPLPTFLDIDHALLGTGWSAARMERGPSAGSDHYPFVITLTRSGSSVRR